MNLGVAITVSSLCGIGLSVSLSAQTSVDAAKAPPLRVEASEQHETVRPPAAFGLTTYSTTSISAATFNSVESLDPITTSPLGYRYFTGGSKQFIGGVSLPEGVIIDYIGINACDLAGGGLQLSLYDTVLGDRTTVGSVSSVTNECLVISNPDPLGYEYGGNHQHLLQIYVVQSDAAPTDGTVGLLGVEVRWRREVSPASTTPTFNDVPTTDPGYQFIQAFANSNITAGCSSSPPLFCPDSPVTRRQIAIFFAKGLGLNWPP